MRPDVLLMIGARLLAFALHTGVLLIVIHWPMSGPLGYALGLATGAVSLLLLFAPVGARVLVRLRNCEADMVDAPFVAHMVASPQGFRIVVRHDHRLSPAQAVVALREIAAEIEEVVVRDRAQAARLN